MSALHRLASLVLSLLLATSIRAEVVALDILQREPFAGGQEFGAVGPYEQITAIARFAIDPTEERNRVMVDLDLAPRNADGKVEFSADVVILAPRDRHKGNGTLFYDVNNRGNKLALGMFNRPPGTPPVDAKNLAGDGFLMKRGYTVLWSGWIGELLPGDSRLLLQAPLARINGQPLRGLVRYEMSSDREVKSMPLSRRDHHGSYAPTREGEANGTLTRRTYENDPRKLVSRDRWKISRQPVRDVGQGVPGTLPLVRLELADGFEPGVLYEWIGEAEGSLVQGVGFAGVRDLVSFLRHEASTKNPLVGNDGKPALQRAYAFGVSQSGRFLRHFLYQRFNEDLRGRIVFEGLMPHVAGGGLGFFNHRFAQPTRHNGQHEDHLYPGDMFPFTYGPSLHPFTRKIDQILSATSLADRWPKIMHTQSAAEYWHRSGSLVHTDPLGSKDAEVPANVRIYSFGGTQHGPASFPPPPGISDHAANFANYRPFLRGLLVALDEWVRTGKEPPASVYPRLKDGTLVAWTQEATGFPKIPGLRFPQGIQQPSFNDYGKQFDSRGIISEEPPRVLQEYRVLVPRSDSGGNDLGMLLPPEVAAPLGSFTGWNLRRQEFGADGVLTNLQGSFIPFAVQDGNQDPRRCIRQRYADKTIYLNRLDAAVEHLTLERYLLQEDRHAYEAYGAALWNYAVIKK